MDGLPITTSGHESCTTSVGTASKRALRGQRGASWLSLEYGVSRFHLQHGKHGQATLSNPEKLA